MRIAQIRTDYEIAIYLQGLSLEAARWNREGGYLDESLCGIVYDTLPIIGIQAKSRSANGQSATEHYECPVYKTSERFGFMTTTGHSSNFLMYLNLPTNKAFPPMHFLVRGTAAFCQLDD